MPVFNGRTYTAAMFSGADGYQYAALWDQFFSDVLVEIGNSAPSLVMQAVNALVATVQAYAAQALAAQQAAVAVSGLSNLNSFQGLLQSGAPLAVFDYDTTRDWDEGAWRKRCTWQSWVSEAASTTRGSRSDHPAHIRMVAVSGFVALFDCDQATPSMWMVFNFGGAALGSYNMAQAPQAIFARDGKLWIAAGGYGVIEIDFVADTAILTNATVSVRYNGGIAARNAGAGFGGATGRAVLTNTVASAVAATVFPGSPIDRATGLPRPTVAVGTGFYLDIIHPSGAVTYPSTSAAVTSVAFDADGFLHACDGTTVRVYHPATLAVTGFSPIRSETASGTPALLGAPTGVNGHAARSAIGLTLRAPDPINPAAGMVAYITASGNPGAGGGAFNTGWMPGDCRLAIASTNTGSVSAANIANWSGGATTGWSTTDGNLTLSTSGSDLQIAETASTTSASKAIYQLSGCVVGLVYLLVINMRRGTVATIMRFDVTDNGQTVQLANGSTSSTSASTIVVQFRATDTSPKVRINFDSPYTAGQTGFVTSLSVDLAEPDRSAYAAGMRIFGQQTRALIAPGSDVTYTGYIYGGYDERPGDLSVGTGDVCFIQPVITFQTAPSSRSTLLDLSAPSGTGAYIRLEINSSGIPQFAVSDGTNSAVAVDTAPLRNSAVTHFMGLKRGATLELWRDGVRVATANAAAVGSLSNSAAVVRRAARANETGNLDGGHIGLVNLTRASDYAPTPEQIAKIVAHDLKRMRGASGILPGTLSAVQALSHDPDTDTVYASKGDGTALLQDGIVTGWLSALSGSTSNNHIAVSARQGGYVIATANQAVASQPAITFRDAILDNRDKVAPIDPNRIVFPAMATTDATPTVIARLPMAEGDEVQLMVDVEAVEYGAAPTERMGYQRRARVYRLPNGNVTVASVQTLGTDYESATTTCDVTVVADTTSQTVCVQATGVAAKRLAWSTLIHINRAGATRYAA
ncbi:hypothetical protein [Nitrospirillum bahiense]|uniref:Concanavalin A-like lectin/glucanase superfamily protein n=1 Tax=Nitrospirillum amazonense TaxID=28077 RepID=A0A560F1U4_9PROT|nr:hypothetical protein [Nitrospirillum amazonense]TWB15589.1 hypothetical protein FBZ88_12942 [Nitrospirillum amazonense]